MAGRRASLLEMMAHPFATLNKIAGLDRLPDRRVSKRRAPTASNDSVDPLRRGGRAQSIYKALGIYALEESRSELYENYREMDTDPVIAAVLDAFGGDAAQRDPEHKRIVWCESSNGAVRKIVTRCLDRNRIDQWAFPVMRALGRDGDVFMHIAAARGSGVVALRPYEPWTVARVEDEIGRLQGFAPADQQGKPAQIDRSAVPHYRVLHFRLPPRELTDQYGAPSSFLWGSRIIWRQLQIMMDQVVIQRLLRRPDRLAILMDTTGMSHDDAWLTIKDYERRLYKEWWLNPATSQFASMGTPLDIAKDVILPRGSGNNTTIQGFPATATNDLMKDLYFLLSQLAAGIQFPLGFIGMGDASTYVAGQSLARQSQPFAKRAARLQDAYLAEVARLCMIDMAFQGLDPYSPHNAFTLNMATVSPIQEIERNEMIQLKTDRMERSIALATNASLDRDVWIPFVLEKYGGLSRELVKQVYKPGAAAPEQPADPPPSPTGPVTYVTEEQKQRAVDQLRERAAAEVGSIIPELEDRLSVSSMALVGDVADGARPWRPDKLDESKGVGVARIDDLLVGAPFAATSAKLMADADGRQMSARHERAKSRVQLITSLAQMLDAGGG